MIFKNKVEIIKNVLFSEYELSSKITSNDWIDEANEIALLYSFSNINDAKFIYNEYFLKHFSDDGFTDFEALSLKIAENLFLK